MDSRFVCESAAAAALSGADELAQRVHGAAAWKSLFDTAERSIVGAKVAVVSQDEGANSLLLTTRRHTPEAARVSVHCP